MNIKNTVISVIIAVIQPKWKRLAMTTLAIFTIAVAGCDGCHKH